MASDFALAELIMLGLGAMLGGMGVWLPKWVMWNVGAFYIAEVYQKRNNNYYLLKRIRVGLGERLFTFGDSRQFIVPANPPVVAYNAGHPVLHYIEDKARPRKVALEPSVTTVEAPSTKGGTRPGDANAKLPDTESQSVALVYKRGIIRQMISATKAADIKASLPLILLAAVAAFAIAYVVFVQFHPGFYPAPPPGYFYKAVPYPTGNSTIP